MKLHLCVFSKKAGHFESKECLASFCVICHGLRPFQPRSILASSFQRIKITLTLRYRQSALLAHEATSYTTKTKYSKL
jgi:hypothetical protein